MSATPTRGMLALVASFDNERAASVAIQTPSCGFRAAKLRLLFNSTKY